MPCVYGVYTWQLTRSFFDSSSSFLWNSSSCFWSSFIVVCNFLASAFYKDDNLYKHRLAVTDIHPLVSKFSLVFCPWKCILFMHFLHKIHITFIHAYIWNVNVSYNAMTPCKHHWKFMEKTHPWNLHGTIFIGANVWIFNVSYIFHLFSWIKN